MDFLKGREERVFELQEGGGNMNRRRKRMAKRMRDGINSLSVELKNDCEQCYADSGICLLPFDEACWSDTCTEEKCEYYERKCDSSSCCPGNLNAASIIRARIKGIRF